MLGIQEHDALPVVQETIAYLAAEMPYETAVETVSRLLPISVSSECAQRITTTVAADLQREQDEERRAAFADPAHSRFPEAVVKPTQEVALVAIDGGMCRIRDQECYSEFKVGVMGTLDPRAAKEDAPAPVTSKHYVAHLTDADSIFEHINVAMHRQGLHHCRTLQVLGDGAPWIWNRADTLRSDGQELILTLDVFHASEHLAEVSRVLFPCSDDQARAWATHMTSRLVHGDLDTFFKALRNEKHTAEQAADTGKLEALKAKLAYFEERRHLLTYDTCRKRGLPIGSGIIEGGIRFVAKDRIHRTGMRWHTRGVEAILQLRAAIASKEWTAFTGRRTAKRMYAQQKLRLSLRPAA